MRDVGWSLGSNMFKCSSLPGLMIPNDFYLLRGIELTKQRNSAVSQHHLFRWICWCQRQGTKGSLFPNGSGIYHGQNSMATSLAANRMVECLNNSAINHCWMDMFVFFHHTTKSYQKERKVPNGWKDPFFWGHIARWQLDVFAVCQATATWWTGMDLVPSYQWNPTKLWEGIHPGYTGEFPIKSRSLIRSVRIFHHNHHKNSWNWSDFSTSFQLIHPKFITEKGDLKDDSTGNAESWIIHWHTRH